MNLRDKNNRAQLEYTLEAQTNDELDLKLLKAYLEATEKYDNTKILKYQALKLKYEALITVPTIIEKTMSPAQLYASNSPLWALNFAGEDIDKLLKRLKDEPRTEEAFNIALRSIQNPMLIMDEFGNLKLNKLHPRNKATLVKQEHLT